MSGSNCCFLTYMKVSQDADEVFWYSHLFKNFPQFSHLFKNFPWFVVSHTVKGFSIVNEAEVNVFLELSCFFYDPTDGASLIFGSSALGFPGGSEVKASACNAGDLGSIPGLGISPGEGNGNPLQYSCLENPMDGGAWWATVHGVTKSQAWLSDFISFFLSSSAFPKSSLNILKFLVHILLKASLENFEHLLACEKSVIVR